MEDCWLQTEEFNFDIPLSPFDGEKSDDITNKGKDDDDDDYDDEVFFGPVGHLERCAAVVAKKDAVEPLKPLDPAEQVLLLKESAKISSLLKMKQQNTVPSKSPVAIVYPFQRDSPGIDMKKLRTFRDKLASKENKENIDILDKQEKLFDDKSEIKRSEEKTEDGVSHNKEALKVSNSVPSPSCKGNVPRRRSSSSDEVKKTQISKIALPTGSSIPKMQSKTAKPSTIPSLKPGLLQGQSRLRGGTAAQESKLKPMKAIKSSTSSASEPLKPKINTLSKGSGLARANSSNAFGFARADSSNAYMTPKKDGGTKHVRSNTAENLTRRKSTNLSTSISRLQFTKPNHNSTPKQPTLKQNSSARRSIDSAVSSLKRPSGSFNTPLRKNQSIVEEKKPIASVSKATKGQDTTSHRPTPSRRSLLPKSSSSQSETPLRAKNAQRRGSLLKYPNRRGSPDKKKPADGNTSIIRSSTFVKSESKSKPKCEISLIEVENNEVNSNVATDVLVFCSPAGESNPTQSTKDAEPPVVSKKYKTDIAPAILHTDILVPEMPVVNSSPLLKFDSPLPENAIADPFATGSTPPTLPGTDEVLAPEQIEANLIQF